MKLEILDILVCPLCKHKLDITVNTKDEEEIVSGFLFCQQCSIPYPIIDTIPNLLPPEQRTTS